MEYKIILEIDNEKDYRQVVNSVERMFNIHDTDFSNDSKMAKYKITPKKYTRNPLYTPEQAEKIITAYKQYLKDLEEGKQYAWYHVREGKKYGLSKKQVVAILDIAGIRRPELHDTRRSKK